MSASVTAAILLQPYPAYEHAAFTHTLFYVCQNSLLSMRVMSASVTAAISFGASFRWPLTFTGSELPSISSRISLPDLVWVGFVIVFAPGGRRLVWWPSAWRQPCLDARCCPKRRGQARLPAASRAVAIAGDSWQTIPPLGDGGSTGSGEQQRGERRGGAPRRACVHAHSAAGVCFARHSGCRLPAPAAGLEQ